jgi:thymidylate synthase (FAD)
MKTQLIDAMASDINVVRAAKVSTEGSGSLATESNEGLIKYLMREKHASPFEHNMFTFYIEAPIFVTREILRHRISSINEESGRYRELKGRFYYPYSKDRPLVQIGKTGDYKFVDQDNPALRKKVNDAFYEAYSVAWYTYTTLLESGVAKEVARMVLPVGVYSSMYFSINARSLMNFLSLRTASNAQWEIQQIAHEMEQYFALHMPVTHHAWVVNGRQSI